MKAALIGSLSVDVAGGAAYYMFAPDKYRPLSMKSDFEQFCVACEDVLKERLKSPSSYLRLDCQGPYTEQATQDKYLDHEKLYPWSEIPDYTREEISKGELYITTAYLEYEAANGFGASIRGLEACTADHRKSESLVEAVRFSGPNVGGYDKSGWIIDQLRSQ